jgi:hypothetical protein
MKFKHLLLALFAAIAGYSAYWYIAANSADEEIQALLADLKSQGIEIDYSQLDVAGFPYRFVFNLEGVRAKLVEGPIEINWRSNNVQAITHPWTPDHFIFFIPASTGVLSRAGVGQLDILADIISASINRSSDGETRASIDFTDLVASKAGHADVLFTADQLALHLRYPRAEARTGSPDNLLGPRIADIALGARSVRLGGSEDPAINELSAVTTLRGWSLPRLNAEDLGRWRDGGGTLEIDPFNITVAGLEFQADGSLTVDRAFRPLGALSTRLSEPDSAADALSALGLIDPADRHQLSQALTLLKAFAGEDGVPLSLSAQDGQVWLGPIEIGQLGALIELTGNEGTN